MGRYALRIFREDLASWVPIVLVIAATSALVGVCANQFAWTSSKAFGAAAGAAGLSAFEFQAVVFRQVKIDKYVCRISTPSC